MIAKRLLLVLIVLVALVAGCGTAAAEMERLNDSTLVYYDDSFVAIYTITSMNLARTEADVLIIFTESELFGSEAEFKDLFPEVRMNFVEDLTKDAEGMDMIVNKFKGFGAVNGQGYFGEWTPRVGYSYYPLTASEMDVGVASPTPTKTPTPRPTRSPIPTKTATPVKTPTYLPTQVFDIQEPSQRAVPDFGIQDPSQRDAFNIFS
jgi:hypothetical protein